MRYVEVIVSSSNADERQGVTIGVDEKRGDIWNRLRNVDIGTDGQKSVKFEIADNQRIVIEPPMVQDARYDPASMSASMPAQSPQAGNIVGGQAPNRATPLPTNPVTTQASGAKTAAGLTAQPLNTPQTASKVPVQSQTAADDFAGGRTAGTPEGKKG